MALLSLLLALPTAAWPQVSLDWKHSAGSLHRTGTFVPFHAKLENTTTDDLVVALVGSWESSQELVARRIELAAGARKELHLYLGPAPRHAEFQVQLKSENGRVLEEVLFSSVWVQPSTVVVGILDPHPLGWGTLQASNQALDRSQRLDHKVAHLDPRTLPGRAEGLRVFDLLIWPEPRPRELTGQQIRAVASWVEAGGHLVLTASQDGDPGWRAWTHIDIEDAVAPFDLESLAPIGGALGPLAEPLAATLLTRGSGSLEQIDFWLNEAWGPVGASERRGAGSTTVFGFDPSSPPISRWPGLGQLWLDVLRRAGLAHRPGLDLTPISVQTPGNYGFPGGDGFDMPSIALGWLSRITGGLDLPLGMLAWIFIAYLVVIGPGEYLLLRRLDRLKWTWITFPVWVALFAALAYAVVAGAKSDVALVRHVLIRDLPPGGKWFIEELHASLFVTRGGRFELASRRPETLPLPKNVFTSPPETLTRINAQGTATISDQVHKWGYLTGSFLSAAPADGARVDAELSWRGEQLEGWLLPHLGTNLSQAWLLAERQGTLRFLHLGSLRNEEILSLDDRTPDLVDREIVDDWLEVPQKASDVARWFLAQTGRRILTQQLSGSGNRFDLTLARLMNDPHPHPDWSSLLEKGDMALVGWAPDSEPRVATRDFDVGDEGIVIYRMGLDPPQQQ